MRFSFSSLRRTSRPLRHALAYGLLRALVGLLRLQPLSVSLALGACLGRLIGLFARRDSRRMRAQLAVLPAPPTVSACWADLGRRFAELACARRILSRFELPPEDAARLGAALDSGRGVLVATSHLGNWELLGAALAARGYDVVAVAARPKASPLHRWLDRERRALGVRALAPGGGARAARRHLAGGGAVALFVDQHTGERGRPIDFFGRPAPTPGTYERLLATAGAVPLLVWCARYTIRVEAVPTGDPLAWLTARLEQLIAADPARWVWLHPRWG